MNIKRRSAPLIALWALAPATAAAAPSGMGATSRASVEIRLSIAPRAGIRMISAGNANYEPCVWSTAAVRSLAVTLRPLSSPATASERFEIAMKPAEGRCRPSEPLRSALATSERVSPGPHLLILAPE